MTHLPAMLLRCFSWAGGVSLLGGAAYVVKKLFDLGIDVWKAKLLKERPTEVRLLYGPDDRVVKRITIDSP
jgi:hypothetical protein